MVPELALMHQKVKLLISPPLISLIERLEIGTIFAIFRLIPENLSISTIALGWRNFST